MTGSRERIAEAAAALRARIAVAAHAAGRDPGSIEIVAASKLRTPEEITAAHEAGITAFGENRVQEWRAKRDGCPPTIRWHLIGPLQRNKVRHAVGSFELLQAIDRIEVTGEISRVASSRGVVQRVLLEVNVSGAPTKHGIDPGVAVETADRIADLPGILLTGLMAVGDPLDPRPGFDLLAELMDLIRLSHPTVTELSMGMSADLEEAIAAGATIVRPGTVLFGPRPSMP